MTVAWSRHGMTLAWKADEFGNPDHALFLGGISVGSLMHSKLVKEKRWRAYFMDSYEGSTVGWFASEQEARDALVDRVVKAMFE